MQNNDLSPVLERKKNNLLKMLKYRYHFKNIKIVVSLRNKYISKVAKSSYTRKLFNCINASYYLVVPIVCGKKFISPPEI